MKKLLPLCLLIVLILCSCGGKTEIIINELPDGGAVAAITDTVVSSSLDVSTDDAFEEDVSAEDISDSPSSFPKTSSKKTSLVSSKTTSVSSKKTSSQTVKSGPYVLNLSTKKFHLSTCTWAGKIDPENKSSSNNRSQLINDGYSPCGHCKP